MSGMVLLIHGATATGYRSRTSEVWIVYTAAELLADVVMSCSQSFRRDASKMDKSRLRLSEPRDDRSVPVHYCATGTRIDDLRRKQLNLCRCCSIIGNQPQVRKLKAGVAMVWSIDSRLMDRVRTIVQLEAQLIAHSSLPKGSVT